MSTCVLTFRLEREIKDEAIQKNHAIRGVVGCVAGEAKEKRGKGGKGVPRKIENP